MLVLQGEPELPDAFAGLAPRRLELGPLSAEAVAEIGQLYLPAAGAAIPARLLAAESAGVPLEAHRAASEWSQERVAERLAASASRAESERGDMRSAEAELASDVIDLQQERARGRLYSDEQPPDPATCPFLGLAPFDAAHADYFFGRERLVAELVARLVGAPLLAVVGPSGSGKSSVVRAGLLPALAGGALPGSERWRQVLVRPGEQPLVELEAAVHGDLADVVASLRPAERLLLMVDQFEEVFVGCRDDEQRTAFLDVLVEAARYRDGRVAVVLAMPADRLASDVDGPVVSDVILRNRPEKPEPSRPSPLCSLSTTRAGRPRPPLPLGTRPRSRPAPTPPRLHFVLTGPGRGTSQETLKTIAQALTMTALSSFPGALRDVGTAGRAKGQRQLLPRSFRADGSRTVSPSCVACPTA